MKHTLLKLLLLILLITPISSYAAFNYHDARVADISDRNYEPAIIELLDSAKESILISMYVISTTTAPEKIFQPRSYPQRFSTTSKQFRKGMKELRLMFLF